MSVKGELRSKPVTDLFQWIEMNNKTGVLLFAQGKTEKCFCFKEGKIIFVSSKKDGERLGEFLSKNGNIDEEKMKGALIASKKEEVPFTQYIIDNKVVPREFLIVAIEQLSEIIISDILDWETGTYRFIDGLPDIVINGPIHINTSYLVFEAVRKHDERSKDKGAQ
ncbi:MAG: DUF4388 domain-containing protein [Thermodesulfovibrionales bacterium]